MNTRDMLDFYKYLLTHRLVHNCNYKSAPLLRIILFYLEISLFVYRWAFSTNHKDIGTLYLIFAGVSGLAGTALSLYLRVNLASPNSGFLDYNYHLYNGASSNEGHACGD